MGYTIAQKIIKEHLSRPYAENTVYTFHVLETEFVIRFTLKDSAYPEKHLSARTATPLRAAV